MRKLERLVNLIALLLNTRRPLTIDEIRQTIPGYQHDDYASFKRMFERDKEELRLLGIPIERRFTDVWEIDEGYLIPPDRYYLPDLDLTPDEWAALWISSRMVVEEGTKEDQALLKLAMGTDADAGSDPQSPMWLRARLYLDAPALPELLEAVAGRRRVKFTYQSAGRAKPTERTVDPYSLVHQDSAWYLVGYDHLRKAIRHFTLQRIVGKVAHASRGSGPEFDVPEGFEPQAATKHSPDRGSEHWIAEKGASVEVALSPVAAWRVQEALGLQAAGEWKGWPTFKLNVSDEAGFISWVVGFGRDAVIRSPDRMRKAIVQRLGELV